MQYPNQGGPPGGMPQGGGMGGPPQPRQAGPQMGGPPQQGGMSGGGPDPMMMAQFRQSQYNPASQVDALRQDLMRAQTMGADPMTIGRLQQELQLAERKVQEFFAQKMGQMSQQQGPGAIGGRAGGMSQRDQNPYLQMLLQAQLGMGGGGIRGPGRPMQ